MGSKVRSTMRSALLIIVSASLAVGQQQGVGPASTIQLQPGQFSVFGQPRQQPVNIPGTQGQVVAQFIDEQGQSIPIQQLGQPQQQQFQPQQQQFQPQQQQFHPQQQRFQPAPQQQFRPAPAENYVHDTTGDATLSRFQQFQLRKKQEAQGAIAPQA